MIDKIGKVITKIFGSKSEKDIKAIQPIVDKINALGPEMEKLSDDQLKAKTQEFRKKIEDATANTSKEIEEVKAKMEDLDNLSQGESRALAEELDRLEQQWLDELEETLDDILPEAYAVLKDTCRRFVGKSWKVAGDEIEWNMIPYDVQLIGAITLHKGMIGEMKTGEGKTLTSIFPAYLNALAGRGVHVITVNLSLIHI